MIFPHILVLTLLWVIIDSVLFETITYIFYVFMEMFSAVFISFLTASDFVGTQLESEITTCTATSQDKLQQHTDHKYHTSTNNTKSLHLHSLQPSLLSKIWNMFYFFFLNWNAKKQKQPNSSRPEIKDPRMVSQKIS